MSITAAKVRARLMRLCAALAGDCIRGPPAKKWEYVHTGRSRGPRRDRLDRKDPATTLESHAVTAL